MFAKTLFFFTCILCICLLVPGGGGVRAQELISARVLSIEGQVEIRRQDNDQPQARKISFNLSDELRAGDTIITGKSGRLVLGLSDGSQAVIAPRTTVVIEDLSQSPRTLFNIIRGKTRIRIEKLGGQPNPYRVNTPTAVIAVRGTIFDVLVEDDETQVFLHEGEVAVANLRAPDQPIILSAGQMTRVMMQRLPNPPGQFKTGRNDGTFKARHNNRPSQDDRRIADGSRRPDSDRESSRSNDSGRPDPARGRHASIEASGNAQPDFVRGGSPSNGAANRAAEPGPNPNSRPGGRRP